MRWQMAAANATDVNTTDDESFFGMAEAELYGTGVSTNFYDQDPAESCRESTMLTYGLVAVLFCCCGSLVIGKSVYEEATQKGDYKPKPPYEYLYIVIKVRPPSLGNTSCFCANTQVLADHNRAAHKLTRTMAQEAHVVLHPRAQPAPHRHHIFYPPV